MYLNHASMNKTKTETDWKRILAYKEGERIPYEPGDGPYDPNDAEAARVVCPGRFDSQGRGGAQRQARAAKSAYEETGFVKAVCRSS